MVGGKQNRTQIKFEENPKSSCTAYFLFFKSCISLYLSEESIKHALFIAVFFQLKRMTTTETQTKGGRVFCRHRCTPGCFISLCMQILTKDGHGNRRQREGEDEKSPSRMEHVQEMDRVRNRKEKDGVMTELQALCLYIHLQAN